MDDGGATPQQQARALRAAGVTRVGIAEALGVTAWQVTDLLRGVTPKAPGLRARAKDELQERARTLRRSGATYDAIAAELGVSKSSLSLWLRDLPKPDRSDHRERVTDRRWSAYRAERERERAGQIEAAVREVGTLTDRELMLVGAVAYWCEGAKSKPWDRREWLAFINSDPVLCRLFLAWLRLVGVADDDISYRLSIHETADIAAAQAAWARIVGADESAFARATLKRHKPSTKRKNTEGSYLGCLIIRVRRSAVLYRKVEGLMLGVAGSLEQSLPLRE